MTAEKLVSRLDMCKSVGRNKWLARCPAHDDRSPSLSITEKDDGRVLVFCHAGCGAVDVIESVGLELSDLFPPDSHYQPLNFRRKKQEKSIDELILEIAKDARRSGKKLTAQEKADERAAFLRLKRSA